MLFCVNTSVSQASVWRRFLRVMFFCARDFCLTVRAFWRAEELRWVEKNLEEMREVDQCSDEMKTVVKNLLRWHVRSEKGWDEARRAHMIWDEMKCGVWSASVKCGVWRVQCEVWRKSSLGVALHRGRAQVMFSDNNTATASHKARTHGPGWRTAHASSIGEKGLYSVTLRQLPPRLVGYYWYSNTESYWTTHWIHWVASGSPAAWQLGWQVGRNCRADS